MADIVIQSTFPPLLRQYSSQVHAIEPSKRYVGIKSLLDHYKTVELQSKPIGPKPPSVKPVTKTSKPIRRETSLDLLKKGIEKEARQRKYEGHKIKQKAEGTVKAWDALIKRNRDQKHHTLQQRVRIQRELIEKNNQLLENQRIKAEEERIERVNSSKGARRERAIELQAHYRRVEEHKKQISRKIQEIEALEESSSQVELKSPLMDDTQRDKGVDGISEPSSNERDKDISPRSTEKAQVAILQILGIESSKSINTMWGGMKAQTLEKISPIIKYSNQLKQVASPSVKQCLEIYEKPTTRDRYTGKPIPLGDVLTENSATRGPHLSAVNNALELLARNSQKKAEIMLENKDTFKSAQSSDPHNYITQQFAQFSHQKSKANLIGRDTQLIVPKRCEASLEVKKQLPSYLTNDGDLRSGSLEELGDQIFCAPSRIKRSELRSLNSVFLTDFHEVSPHGSPSNSDLSTAGSWPSLKGSSVWEPLSTSALTEYQGVTELPVSGLGHLAHGKYSMWRPATCVVDSQDNEDT